mmetsp:Transcript_31944/g.69755  ORF Transcript_31944/g.69755 Transcript_31944/m.69755 type:complete len:635 (-) Transcript_31944:26-1930(-)
MAEQQASSSKPTSVGEAYGKIADDNKKDEVAADEIDTVWKASAYGDTDKLKEMLEADRKLANTPDEAGRLPIQWAALNNRVAAITLLMQFGADVNAAEPGGQTALHWSATRGAIPSLELLLRSGATLTHPDQRGYTVCHVAAQFGQTAVLHHLALRWDADIDSRDNDGRSPLHWAAYKGFGDPIRLLLCLGARPLLTDKEGCTALHWGAIKGHSEVCTVLVQGGAAETLAMTDTTGSSPAQLAMQKGHMMCSDWLNHEAAKHEREMKRKNFKGFFKNGEVPRGLRHLAPVLWGVILGLLFMFVQFVVRTQHMPSISTPMAAFAWMVVGLACTGLGFLYKAGVSDPGFICCGENERKGDTESGKPNVGNLDDQQLWDGHWHMLCMQCRRVRPPRSKYCRVSKRCVSRFDHYCPWIGNTVGEKNHAYFVIFLMLETAAMTVALLVAAFRLSHTGEPVKVLMREQLGAVSFVILDGFVLLSVSMLTCSQLGQVFANLTTNEMINQHRYRYLHSADGSFRNPYDKGCWPNTVEFFLGVEMKGGSPTEAPLLQKVDSRGESQHSMHHALASGMVHDRMRGAHGHDHGCEQLIGLCGRLCGGHNHGGHSHGGKCCNHSHGSGSRAKVHDIEEAFGSTGGL